ncbi:MAG: hypothetical protein JSU73_04315, partial [candidate division WOR-3 bacterium]
VDVEELTVEALTDETEGFASCPSFAFDGRIVYARQDTTGVSSIWVMDSDGGGKTLLSDLESDCQSPHASPASLICTYVKTTQYGDTICVDTLASGSWPEADIVAAQSQEEELHGPRFSENGEYVVFTASDFTGSRILEVETAGGSPEVLAGYAEDREAFCMSSDGRWLAYQCEDTLSDVVSVKYLRRFTGGGISVWHVDKSAFDATQDSVRIDFSIESDRTVTVWVEEGESTVRTLINQVPLEAGDYNYYWNGRKDNQKLALPAGYTVRITAGADSRQSPVQVLGTQVYGTVAGTWTTSGSPYVLTADVNVNSSTQLDVQSGVCVMPTGTQKIDVYGRLIAKGDPNVRTSFTPYRKLEPVADPVLPGTWGNLVLQNGSACTLNYCVVEYGGCDVDRGMVHVLTDQFSVTNSVLRGGKVDGIHIGDNELNSVQVLNDSFVGNNIGLNKWKLGRLEGLTQTCWFEGNTEQHLSVHCGADIASSAAWYCCGPGMRLLMSQGFRIRGSASACTLRLMPGLRIEVPSGDRIYVGDPSDTDHGVLLAEGRAGDGWISFAGQGWRGIEFQEDDCELWSRLRYCKVSGVSGGYKPAGVNVDNSRVSVARCSIFGCRDVEDHDGAGVFVDDGVLELDRSYFHDNDIGVLYNTDEVVCPPIERCQFTDNDSAVLVASGSGSLPDVHHSNFIGNNAFAVCNRNSASYVDAADCYWNTPDTSRGPNGGDTVYRTNWRPASGDPHVIMPEVDVATVAVLSPTGWYVSDTAVMDTPRVVVENEYDDTLEFPCTIGIGQEYIRTLEILLPGESTDTLLFPLCTLQVGEYSGHAFASASGDVDPSNDTVDFEISVRESLDVACLQVVTPLDTITIEDLIAPTVEVANFTDTARYVPVKFYLDSVLVATDSAFVAPQSTAELAFDERTFVGGPHEIRFAACRVFDDDRSNDTTLTSIFVLTG